MTFWGEVFAKEDELVMLVMKRPRNCEDCKLHDISSMRGDRICLPTGKWIETQNERAIPDWCPLRNFKGVIC